MKINFLKASLAVVLLALTATSCKKESASSDAGLSPKNEQAVVTVGSTVTGSFTNTNTSATDPTTGWGTINYSLLNNATGTGVAYATFTQQFNGNINEAGGYNIGYIDLPSISNVSSITLADIPAGSVTWTPTTFGINNSSTIPGPGWYNYNTTTRTIAPVSNRYLVYSATTNYSGTGQIYVIQLSSIVGGGAGPFTTAVQFQYKRLK
jgi:hypothetical protein